MVVAVSTERYRAVCHPLMRRQAYYKYIIIVVILSITIEFPRFFEMKLINDNSAYWTTDLMENPDYVLFSSYWNDIIVTGLLPLVLLCYLNLRVFIKIKVSCLIIFVNICFTLLLDLPSEFVGENIAHFIYRYSPVSAVSISAVFDLVRFTNSTK